jgi:hypothetical protein
MSDFKETKYAQIGGVATIEEAYRKLQWHIDEARNQCLVISHLRMAGDDNQSKLIAKGWAGMEEMLAMVQEQVRQIAMRKMS